MSKRLDTVIGCKVVRQYHADDKASALLIKTFTSMKPIPHSYYELVDANGNIRFIIQEEVVALSAAGRLGLDYRKVEFEEEFEEIREESSLC